MGAAGWGLTYIVHPGFWVWTTVPPAILVVAHLIVVIVWLLAVAGWCWYFRWYRESLAIDIAVAALTVSAFGNLIDRLLVGGARDWWITQIAVAHFADISVRFTVAAVLLGVVAIPAGSRARRAPARSPQEQAIAAATSTRCEGRRSPPLRICT